MPSPKFELLARGKPTSRSAESVEKVPARHPSIAAQRRIDQLEPGTRFYLDAVKQSAVGRRYRGIQGIVLGPGQEGGIEVRIWVTTHKSESVEEWCRGQYVTPIPARPADRKSA